MAFVLLFCLGYALVLYCLKKEELKEYTTYDAKVIGFTNVTVSESVPSTRGHASNYTYSRDIPIIEYKNKEGKIISYEDGNRVLFSSFELNEKIKVLENKENKYKVKICSFFYFWFHIYEFVLFIFLLFIFYVFISVFVFRDFYISDF
ncbi:hypothetical protein [Flavobacterium difficile]|uniref:DUF3592 domain-containing protein n=1 Tax=Flavobacterium difficile TaxID=2709659 RepID=A0ABX0I358_9FLAO|nr:hypothetical protein [Flavobacterium difficile]NHM01612.1 hypothetical protein [Flavobacterium difficile]